MTSSTISSPRPQTRQAKIGLGHCLASRLGALAAASFRPELLPPADIALDLRNPCRGGASLLRSFLLEASIPLLPVGAYLGRVAIDAPLFLDRRESPAGAGFDLALGLYLALGALGSSEGPCLLLAEEGASPRDCRLLEDRLAWLGANRALIGPGEVGLWLPALAAAFEADFGQGF